MTKTEDKRKLLKAAGWRRQDLGNVERWFPPTPATDRSSCLGQSLRTAWNYYQWPNVTCHRCGSTRVKRVEVTMLECQECKQHITLRET